MTDPKPGFLADLTARVERLENQSKALAYRISKIERGAQMDIPIGPAYPKVVATYLGPPVDIAEPHPIEPEPAEFDPGPLCDNDCIAAGKCDGHTLYDLKRAKAEDAAEVIAALRANPAFANWFGPRRILVATAIAERDAAVRKLDMAVARMQAAEAGRDAAMPVVEAARSLVRTGITDGEDSQGRDHFWELHVAVRSFDRKGVTADRQNQSQPDAEPSKER